VENLKTIFLSPSGLFVSQKSGHPPSVPANPSNASVFKKTHARSLSDSRRGSIQEIEAKWKSFRQGFDTLLGKEKMALYQHIECLKVT
jgi:hypothetical protein